MIRIILLQNVPNLGKIGEQKEVKEGYARNFLIPKGMAVLPQDPRAHELLAQKSQKQESKKEKENMLSGQLEELNGQTIKLKMKANAKGKLFKAIQPKDLAKELKISEKIIKFEPIETLGEHKIELKQGDKKATILVVTEKEI